MKHAAYSKSLFMIIYGGVRPQVEKAHMSHGLNC